MQTPQQLSNTFGQVAAAIEPAVVNVSTESTPKVRRRGNNRAPNRGQRDNGGATILSRTSLTASLADSKAGRADKAVRAAMMTIKVQVPAHFPVPAADASVRSVQA